MDRCNGGPEVDRNGPYWSTTDPLPIHFVRPVRNLAPPPPSRSIQNGTSKSSACSGRPKRVLSTGRHNAFQRIYSHHPGPADKCCLLIEIYLLGLSRFGDIPSPLGPYYGNYRSTSVHFVRPPASAGPDVDRKWTEAAPFRSTSGPLLLRSTAVHFDPLQ